MFFWMRVRREVLAVGHQIFPQERERRGAIAVRGQDLSLHFDGRAQGQRQMRLGVHRARGERLQGQLFGFLGLGIGLVELARDQIPTREPGERLQVLGRHAVLRSIALEDRLGEREIAVRHRSLDVGDDGRKRPTTATRAAGISLRQHLHRG